MAPVSRFNIRVYGLLCNTYGEVLLVHEQIGEFTFTKFPGGGLEFGEGITDCLIREFKEETGIDIVPGKHIYTTEFFQQSAFRETDQLIAIYYEAIALSGVEHIRLEEHVITTGTREEILRFEWVPLSALTPDLVTFPIDKKVVEMIQKKPL